MDKSIYYRLAGITIHVHMDFDYRAEMGYMNKYLVPVQEHADYEFHFRQIDDISRFTKKAPFFMGQMQKFHYYQDADGTEYCFHLKGEYYHAVTVIGPDTGTCYYISQGWLKEEVDNGYYLENFFCLEKIFMQFRCMVLHSCHVQKNGQAILFSAPSGTGKSTQGELWRKYAQADVINGDRTAIRKVDGVWMAYGVPFCGTSQINQNKEAPLKAVVILRQFPENQVSLSTGKEAFFSIYSELTVNSWNQEFVKRTIDWVTELLFDIPVCRFMCTKEPEAVAVLQEFIDGIKKEDINDKC